MALFCRKIRRPTIAGQRKHIVGRVKARAISAIDKRNTQPVPLYVPLRIFCCLRSRLKGTHCHNLMHFVHKLMHTLMRSQD